MALLQGCPSRAEIEAAAWLNTGLDPALCAQVPELKNYGFYRKLNNGKYEFLSYCSDQATHWISFYDLDLKRILDATIKKTK